MKAEIKEKKNSRRAEILLCGLCGLLLSVGLLVLLPASVRAEEYGSTAGTIIEISDGYSSQQITPNPYGNTTETVYVNPKTKKVTIAVKGTDSTEEGISFLYESQLSMTEDEQYTAIDKVRTSTTWDGQEQKDLVTSTLICLKRLQKPEVSLSVSAGAKSGYVPNAKNKIYIQARVQSDLDSTVTITVYNASDKEVYRKKFAAGESYSQKKLYEIDWNAKPSKSNKAGLSASNFIPKGTYKIVAEASVQAGSSKLTMQKSKTLQVVGSGSVPTYGNDQKNMVPILTGDLETDYMAELILSKIIKDNMTNEQKIKAVYTWVVKNIKHDEDRWNTEKFPVVYEKDILSLPARKYLEECRQKAAAGEIVYSNQSASDVLKRRVGVCSTISQTLQVLLNHLGFESSVVHGMYKNRNGSTLDHYWNNVKLNGTMYWLDVDVELSNWKGGGVNYYWYLKGDKEWKTNHIWYE